MKGMKMNIVTYRPQNRLGSFFESFNDLRFPSLFSYDNSFKVSSPKVHVYEDKNNLILKFDMPGLNKDDIEIDLSDRFLTISGARSPENIEIDTNIYQEIDYGDFQRTLDLGDYALKDNISAEYNNGILELVFSLSDDKHVNGKKIKIK
tara:strand:- start:6545 stop:6991 length:447 start_codon:yes stop_codon:yes gene_type:complete